MSIISTAGRFNHKNISAQLAAGNLTRDNCPVPRIFLVLCHNNALLERFLKAGFPGHYDNRVQYTNKFLTEYRSYADFREAAFDVDDSSMICMTYGQASKLFRQIHSDLVRRSSKGQEIDGSRICVATHVLLMDSWYPSKDLVTFLYTYDNMLSYGCFMPRLVHVSQGPFIVLGTTKFVTPAAAFSASSLSSNVTDFSCVELSQIQLYWRIANSEIEESIKELSDTINAIAIHLQRVHAEYESRPRHSRSSSGLGNIYIIVPDNHVAILLRAKIAKFATDVKLKLYGSGSESGAESGDEAGIRLVLYDQILTTNFTKAGQFIIIPYLRRDVAYVTMPSSFIVAIIALCPSYFTDDAMPVPVKVSVIYKTAPETTGSFTSIAGSFTSVSALMSRYPCDPRENVMKYVKSLNVDDQIRVACQMAESSMQIGHILPDAVIKAADACFVNCVIVDRIPKIVKMTGLGAFATRANISPKIGKFLMNWQKVPHLLFPAYCLVALMERVSSNRPALLVNDVDVISRIATENEYTDPLTHQLQVISDYIKTYGLEIISIDNMSTFAEKYGADPSTLTACIVRIAGLHAAGLTEDSRYGPFNPSKMISILTEYKLFSVADFVPGVRAGAAYMLEGGKIRYVIPTNSPYSPAMQVMIIHAESLEAVSAHEKNTLKEAELLLYAILKKGVH
jgi:hypothetical protein